MPVPPPKLRSDLVITRQQSGGQIYFIVKDPVQRRYFRLQEPEYFIAQRLDGSNSTEAVRTRVEDEFGVSLSTDDLNSFIEKLSRLGILESSQQLRAPETGIRGRLRGTPLYIRWSIFDPDSLLNWLDARLRFLYTRGFLVFSLLLIFAAAFVTVDHAGEIGLQLVGSFGFGMLALAWLFAVLAVVLHEFSHGITCKRFGGEVHEMGILFLFFMIIFITKTGGAD